MSSQNLEHLTIAELEKELENRKGITYLRDQIKANGFCIFIKEFEIECKYLPNYYVYKLYVPNFTINWDLYKENGTVFRKFSHVDVTEKFGNLLSKEIFKYDKTGAALKFKDIKEAIDILQNTYSVIKLIFMIFKLP